jgi:hypothetical protein
MYDKLEEVRPRGPRSRPGPAAPPLSAAARPQCLCPQRPPWIHAAPQAGCSIGRGFVKVEHCDAEVGGGFRPPDGVRAPHWPEQRSAACQLHTPPSCKLLSHCGCTHTHGKAHAPPPAGGAVSQPPGRPGGRQPGAGPRASPRIRPLPSPGAGLDKLHAPRMQRDPSRIAVGCACCPAMALGWLRGRRWSVGLAERISGAQGGVPPLPGKRPIVGPFDVLLLSSLSRLPCSLDHASLPISLQPCLLPPAALWPMAGATCSPPAYPPAFLLLPPADCQVTATSRWRR